MYVCCVLCHSQTYGSSLSTFVVAGIARTSPLLAVAWSTMAPRVACSFLLVGAQQRWLRYAAARCSWNAPTAWKTSLAGEGGQQREDRAGDRGTPWEPFAGADSHGECAGMWRTRTGRESGGEHWSRRESGTRPECRMFLSSWSSVVSQTGQRCISDIVPWTCPAQGGTGWSCFCCSR